MRLQIIVLRGLHALLFPLWACAFDRALVSVAAGVVRRRGGKKSFMCVVLCESSSGHLTKPEEGAGGRERESRMLARPPRERRTREGGEKLRRDATAPRAHRRSYGYGGSLHRTITSRAQDTPGGLPLAEEEEVDGRGGGSYSETTVRITESHRHGSFHPE